MLKFASLHRLVIGAGGFALLALAPLPSLAAGDPPKPAEKCSEFKEGSAEWKYAEALDVLRSARDQSDPRIQTMIGFSLRKLGLVDEAMGYYAAALRADPSLTSTRQYLGEAYLHKGERAKAVEQLAEIGRRCGTTCEHYKLLADAIAES